MICEREKEKKNRREKWLILLLLLILLVLGMGILLSSGEVREENATVTAVPEENTGDGVGLVIDPDAKNSQLAGKSNTKKQDVAISGRSSMTIPAHEKEVTVDFYNPKENKELYYLTFQLRLFHDNQQGYEILYTSGLVEPGKRINRITLSRGLEQGMYDAVIHVQPYRMNQVKTLTNNADMKIKLIVE